MSAALDSRVDELRTAIATKFLNRVAFDMTPAEANAANLSPIKTLLVNGIAWPYDASDTTSVHDGTTVIVSLDGRRYKPVPGIAVASDTVAGAVELATNVEAVAGTDTERVLTPASGKALVDAEIANALEGEDLSDIAAAIVALQAADQNLVSAGAAQTFSAAEQQQARDNIGAVTATDTDYAADFNGQLP